MTNHPDFEALLGPAIESQLARPLHLVDLKGQLYLDDCFGVEDVRQGLPSAPTHQRRTLTLGDLALDPTVRRAFWDSVCPHCQKSLCTSSAAFAVLVDLHAYASPVVLNAFGIENTRTSLGHLLGNAGPGTANGRALDDQLGDEADDFRTRLDAYATRYIRELEGRRQKWLTDPRTLTDLELRARALGCNDDLVGRELSHLLDRRDDSGLLSPQRLRLEARVPMVRARLEALLAAIGTDGTESVVAVVPTPMGRATQWITPGGRCLVDEALEHHFMRSSTPNQTVFVLPAALLPVLVPADPSGSTTSILPLLDSDDDEVLDTFTTLVSEDVAVLEALEMARALR